MNALIGDLKHSHASKNICKTTNCNCKCKRTINKIDIKLFENKITNHDGKVTKGSEKISSTKGFEKVDSLARGLSKTIETVKTENVMVHPSPSTNSRTGSLRDLFENYSKKPVNKEIKSIDLEKPKYLRNTSLDASNQCVAKSTGLISEIKSTNDSKQDGFREESKKFNGVKLEKPNEKASKNLSEQLIQRRQSLRSIDSSPYNTISGSKIKEELERRFENKPIKPLNALEVFDFEANIQNESSKLSNCSSINDLIEYENKKSLKINKTSSSKENVLSLVDGKIITTKQLTFDTELKDQNKEKDITQNKPEVIENTIMNNKMPQNKTDSENEIPNIKMTMPNSESTKVNDSESGANILSRRKSGPIKTYDSVSDIIKNTNAKLKEQKSTSFISNKETNYQEKQFKRLSVNTEKEIKASETLINQSPTLTSESANDYQHKDKKEFSDNLIDFDTKLDIHGSDIRTAPKLYEAVDMNLENRPKTVIIDNENDKLIDIPFKLNFESSNVQIEKNENRENCERIIHPEHEENIRHSITSLPNAIDVENTLIHAENLSKYHKDTWIGNDDKLLLNEKKQFAHKFHDNEEVENAYELENKIEIHNGANFLSIHEEQSNVSLQLLVSETVPILYNNEYNKKRLSKQISNEIENTTELQEFAKPTSFEETKLVDFENIEQLSVDQNIYCQIVEVNHKENDKKLDENDVEFENNVLLSEMVYEKIESKIINNLVDEVDDVNEEINDFLFANNELIQNAISQTSVLSLKSEDLQESISNYRYGNDEIDKSNNFDNEIIISDADNESQEESNATSLTNLELDVKEASQKMTLNDQSQPENINKAEFQLTENVKTREEFEYNTDSLIEEIDDLLGNHPAKGCDEDTEYGKKEGIVKFKNSITDNKVPSDIKEIYKKCLNEVRNSSFNNRFNKPESNETVETLDTIDSAESADYIKRRFEDYYNSLSCDSNECQVFTNDQHLAPKNSKVEATNEDVKDFMFILVPPAKKISSKNGNHENQDYNLEIRLSNLDNIINTCKNSCVMDIDFSFNKS